MGLSKARTLLEVKQKDGESLNFLDIIARRVLGIRKKYAVKLPFIFMNSFRTEADTLNYVRKYPTLFDNSPKSFIQEKEPKILQSNLEPVRWDKNPELEWCPAGHGEIYCAFYNNGVLRELNNKGMEYLFISNADNLGAMPSPETAGHFAKTGAPFMSEVSVKTVADRKGGHIVKKDGRFVLREFSQISSEDEQEALNPQKHPFININNIWVNIPRLIDLLDEQKGVVSLPLIRNDKTVDPKDSASYKVYQIESAMGAGIELFADSTYLLVDRSRFLPVKKTADLLVLRSDFVELNDEYELVAETYNYPNVILDEKYYALIDDFNERFPKNAPSLKNAKSFRVKGNFTFAENVKIEGDATFANESDSAIFVS
jgi:UTP--glucose-1-phosphate uridylyltransferase